MKPRIKPVKWMLAAGILLSSACVTSKHEHRSEVKPGEWTANFEAAKAVAREQRLPILLNFTGSDWCPPCQMMEKEVFSKPEWKAYAKEFLVPVAVDLSKEAFMDMRQADPETDALRIAYDITGYPSFILLDYDGKTELGRLLGRRLACLSSIPRPPFFPSCCAPSSIIGQSKSNAPRERCREKIGKTTSTWPHNGRS